MKNMRGLALGLAAVLLLSGCGAGADSSGSSFAPAEEDRLVVYTSHKEEVWWPIVREFEERTGIWVDVVTGGTNELLERIAQEAEDPAADVMFGGGVDSLEVYQDCFEPYLCAGQEEIIERYRSEDGLWTPFSALPVVLIYNTKLLSPEEVTSWRDLLLPQLRGKIAFADPGVSGSCFTGLATLLQAVGGSQDDALRQFAYNLDGLELEARLGEVLFTNLEIEVRSFSPQNLALMQEYVESLGADFVFTIAPDKSTLYPEHLPGYPQSGEPSSAERLAAAMEELGVNYVNLFKLFSAQDEVYYFEHDSHWNSRGAALAADALNAALGVGSSYAAGYEYETVQHTGDLFDMLYPAGTDTETNDAPTALNFDQGANIRPDSITIDTTSDGVGRLLMFRDSFGELLYPFMAEGFASARFSRQAAYDLTTAEELSSTAVVIELVERNLSWLYEQPAVFPAPERELSLASEIEGEATLEADAALDGAHSVTGVISGNVDVDSDVYIAYNGAVYECLLTADGYTACLPGEGGGEYTLFWYSDGNLTHCDMSVNI